MTISDSQKVDYLWKKIGYSASKSDAVKQGFEEAIASPLQIRGDKIMANSASIPTSIPGANSSIVTVYTTSAPVEATVDGSTTPSNRTWKTSQTDWISPEFGSTYQVKVYIHTSGSAGTAASSGTSLSAGGSGYNDEWFFDYQAGTLHFIGTNLPYSGGSPISFTGKSIYISGARYTGTFGIPGAQDLGYFTFSGNTASTSQINGNLVLSASGVGAVQIAGNTALGLPHGGTSSRPGIADIGYARYNTDIESLEIWDGTDWIAPGLNTVTSQTITPDGIHNAYYLSANTTASGVLVSINGTLQQPTTAYGVVGNVITFTETPLSSDIIEIRALSSKQIEVGSLAAGALAVGLNTGTGEVQITGNLVPSANTTFNLGSPTLRWNTAYLNATTLDIGGGQLRVINGALVFTYAGVDQLWAANGLSTANTFSASTLTVQGNLAVGGNIIVTGNLTVLGTTTTVNTEIVNQNEIITGNLSASGNLTVTGNLNVFGTMSNTVTIPTSINQTYVAKNGSDSNNGSINQPYLTIKAALAAATSGTSVHVAPGSYTENNPVTIPSGVSLIGDNLRSVTVYPQTASADLFYVTNGCYVWGITIKDYLANGFSYSSATSSQNVYVSPYIQNITSSTTLGTAVMVDGNFTSAASTKAMIAGFFTIINQGGVGVHLTNSAYSQLVNIYTIGANVGIWAESGSFCTLNGSDNSIGNIGLRADGYGPLQTYGLTSGYSTAGTFVIQNPYAPPHVNQVMIINGDPVYYSIDTITKIDSVTYQINILETYSGNLAPSSNIAFYQRSAVVASAHTFEYVGAGIIAANALPQYGGYPDATKNVVTTGGGRVTYTATDEKGNFWIGSNLVINQATGTIGGDSFSKSMFSLMTPYILALSL